MMEMMFLLAFTLHNIEEGLWLPQWSGHAAKYHTPVTQREFHFALLMITVFAYLLTFLVLTLGTSTMIIKTIYAGFVLMMCLNAVFPHLLSTIALRRYAPGTLTGVLLNLPVGLFILNRYIINGLSLGSLLLASAFVSLATLISLRHLFKLGAKLLDEY